MITAYPFVMCVHGGGIDPSPKAWETIRAGSIPIILNNTLYDAYRQLPVVFINNFTELLDIKNANKTLAKMKLWIEELKPYYETNSILRNQTLYRLTAKYWFNNIIEKLKPYYTEEDLLNYYY